MNRFDKLQELRRRRRAEMEEETTSSTDSVNTEEVKPTKKTKKSKGVPHKYNRDVAMNILKGKKDKPKRGRPRKIKESNSLFIDEWHDTCEFLPDESEDVWFIFDGKIRVGFYEPQQQIFCMADGLGAELRDVRQWKYVGSEKQIAIYPKERQIVAVNVVGFPCLATGIFTDHCVDPDTYKEKSGIILDEDYEFKDRCVDFKDVNYWYDLVEEPLVILDPVEDSVLAVFPDEQEVIADKTGVVLDTPPEVEEEFAMEEPYKAEPASDGVQPFEGTIDFESNENTPVTSDVGEADITMEDMTDRGIKSAIANYTKKEESKSMIMDRLTEEQVDAVREVLAQDKVKDWYCAQYPTDELGEEIREDITFMDVFDCLDRYMDVYDCLGVWDSIVRERVFTKLAEIMEVDSDYDYVYDQWMLTKDYPFVKYSESKNTKGSKLNEKRLKEDNYGWNIRWDSINYAYDAMCEAFGKDDLDSQIVDCLSTDELKACLEFICRMNDFEGDFLEGHEDEEYDDDYFDEDDEYDEDAEVETDEEDYDEGFNESISAKANKLKESMNLKQYHLDALPKELRKDLVNYLYDVKK
jgi:hypothetical protein